MWIGINLRFIGSDPDIVGFLAVRRLTNHFVIADQGMRSMRFCMDCGYALKYTSAAYGNYK